MNRKQQKLVGWLVLIATFMSILAGLSLFGFSDNPVFYGIII